MSDSIKTLCPYCGVGCGLEVSPPAQAGKATNRDSQGNPIWKVRGDRSHPSSQGMVCVKGATIAEAISKNRLLYPMVRDTLDEPFRRVSWDEALERIVNRIQTVRAEMGPDGLCMYGSGQLQTEDYYVAQKLLKGCLGTNNFDSNSRLCMSSTICGYVHSLGSDGPPCCYDDLELTDCAFLIGTNAAECHPIVFNRLRKHHKQNRNVKMIVVDPRRTPTAEAADLHLAIQPGTDIDLLNGIAHLLLRWGSINVDFINDCTANFADFCEVIAHYPPEVVAKRCGISVSDLETAARYWSGADRVLSLWLLGLNQSIQGTAKVRTLINLHLMTGQIGKPGAGPFSLTGQPNAMGGRETGGNAQGLPGYRFIKNPQHRAEVEQFWGLKPGQISPHPGRTALEIITGLENGEVGFLWVAATNPAVTLPDLERTKAALRRSPFTVCQDAYYPTETAAYAHVLLPAAQWGEKTGTMTNSERRVTLCQAFRAPMGQAKADWEIFADVGRRLGFAEHFPFTSSAEVYAEFVQLTRDRPCDQTGISHERLIAEGPMQWPAPSGSDELGVRSDELGVRSDRLGVRSDELGVRSDELGVRSDELEVRSDELGVRSDELEEKRAKVSSSSTHNSVRAGLSQIPVGKQTSQKNPPLQTPNSVRAGLSEIPVGKQTLQKNPPLQTQNSPKRLYTDLRFNTPDGRARFAAYHSKGLAEPPDEQYPYVLINGRLYGHWHTQTRTGRIEKIREMHPQPFLEIHPRDAAQLGVRDQEWIEVRSRRGKARFPVTITKAITPGTVFVPMHWGSIWATDAEANALSHHQACPDSLQPELKACAVQLLPVAASREAEFPVSTAQSKAFSPSLSV